MLFGKKRNEEFNYGKTFNVGIEAQEPNAAGGASEYNWQNNLPFRPDTYNHVTVDLPQARQIAKDYLAAPDFDPAAVPHFKAMAEETKRQYDFMTKSRRRGGMGIEHELTSDGQDPYKNSRDMINDVHRGHIYTFPTSTTNTQGHPLFTNDENDMFRAIHDVFGHAGAGRNFNAAGEEAAFRSHYNMFSPMARPAMATETRGQNSVNNFGGLPKGEFIHNKIVTLPSTQIILPRPKQLVIPGGRRTMALQQGLDDARQSQETAMREHEMSFGLPGEPHPDAKWLR